MGHHLMLHYKNKMTAFVFCVFEKFYYIIELQTFILNRIIDSF